MTNREIEKTLYECKFDIHRLEKDLHDTRCMLKEVVENKKFVSQDEFYSTTIKKALAFEIIAKCADYMELIKWLDKVKGKDYELVIKELYKLRNTRII